MSWWAAFVVFGVVLIVRTLVSAVILIAGYAISGPVQAGDEGWWQLLAGFSGLAAAFAVLWTMTLRAGRPPRDTLQLRSAPIWAYLFVPWMAVLVGPWKALIASLAFDELPVPIVEPLSSTVQLLGLVLTVLISPFLQEALFRGYIVSALKERSQWTAVIGSTILFGLWHLGLPWWEWMTHLPFGLAMAMCVIRFRSIYPLVFAHALWNFLSALGYSPGMWFEPTIAPLLLSALLFTLSGYLAKRRI